MLKLSKEQQETITINRYFKQARAKMKRGIAYTIDELLPVDSMSDQEVTQVMKRLDNHPLIRIDSEFPKKWSLV